MTSVSRAVYFLSRESIIQMSINSEQRDVKIGLIEVYVPETESDLPMAIVALQGAAKNLASKG